MHKAFVLSIIVAVTMCVATSTALAQSSRSTQVQFQKQRYYHALGYYHAIWNVARRTVYSPNHEIRIKWLHAIHYLRKVQQNSHAEIVRLTTPKSPYPSSYPPHYAQWMCIHGFEGSWTDSGAPFWGGLQMDWNFMSAYGAGLLKTKGTADHWTPLEQMWAAEKAWKSRGFYPWPNTARYCGLI